LAHIQGENWHQLFIRSMDEAISKGRQTQIINPILLKVFRFKMPHQEYSNAKVEQRQMKKQRAFRPLLLN